MLEFEFPAEEKLETLSEMSDIHKHKIHNNISGHNNNASYAHHLGIYANNDIK